jgi:peroxiredoxin
MTQRGVQSTIAALVVGLAATLLVGSVVLAQSMEQEEDKVAIGKELPGFALPDYTGKEHRLEKHRGKVVVLDFSSQHCPYSRAADPELAKITREYEEDEAPVVVLSIDSHRATPPADIKEYAEEHDLPFPILKDEGNVYADELDAKRTPEIYIVDKEGVLRYHGAFDNRRKPDSDDYVNYVRKSVDALLADEEVDPETVSAYGCTIKRK